ncbi:MAG: hypothetical protein AB7U75_14830 [Hyphomicrobiaceae bacterium]
MHLTTLPFSGFYETHHDDALSRAIEMFAQDDSGHDYSAKLSERLYLEANWKNAHEKYARGYADMFADFCGIEGMEFDELNSPREYNFGTDRIFVRIPRDQLVRIFDEVSKSRLSVLAKQAFTSRSGFASFYDDKTDIVSWGKDPDGWDHNQIGLIMQAYADGLSRNGDYDYEQEFDIMESALCNGFAEDCVFDNMSSEMDRLCSIASYLRERDERKWRTRRVA